METRWNGTDSLDSFYTVLDRLEGLTATFDELDCLAKRLDSFCEREDSQFQGMACALDLADISDFINLTFCCQEATVITSFSDLERIGRDHFMNINGGSIPMEEYHSLDGRRIALDLIEESQGTVTPYGVVYDNGMQIEPLYNGRQFPGYLYGDCLLALEAVPKQAPAKEQNPEYLYLPASERQIERALLRIGVQNPEDAVFRPEFDALPNLISDAIAPEHDSICRLNELCRAVGQLNQTELNKLEAVLSLTKQPKQGPQMGGIS